MLYIPLRIPLRQVLLRYLNLSAFEKMRGSLAVAISHIPQETRHFLPFLILFYVLFTFCLFLLFSPSFCLVPRPLCPLIFCFLCAVHVFVLYRQRSNARLDIADQQIKKP
jgi:hypothetical protein